jgi:hypothetical protein
MTALPEFERLESGGLWRASPDAQRRDVTVSFGNATLVIADGAGRALTHWSLPALIRKNAGKFPALYVPDAAGSEELELDDETMINAIEKVSNALIRAKPKPGKLRLLSTATIIAAIIVAGVFWAPAALTRQTLSVVPQSKRTEIGATILGHYQRLTGTTCRNAAGTQALASLKTRLLGRDASGQFVVVQTLPQGAVTLPGGITLLDRALVEQHDDVAIPAGFIIAANSDRGRNDLLDAVLKQAGLRMTMTLLTTGDLPSDVLKDYALSISQDVTPATDQDAVLAAFDAAQISTLPYAAVLDTRTSTPNDGLVARDPMSGRDTPLILEDRAWVGLQGICTS